MPQPTPLPVRDAIFEQWQQGRSPGEIAQSLDCPVRTVRHLIQRFRERGQAGIATSYSSQGQPASPERKQVREAAEHLRREHSTWGSTVIHLKLRKSGSGEHLPTPRTIRRWLAQSGLAPAPRGKRLATESSRAERPHQTWQIDASEEISLADGSKVSWLRIVDEFTGAVLKTRVFSLRTVEPCFA